MVLTRLQLNRRTIPDVTMTTLLNVVRPPHRLHSTYEHLSGTEVEV